jgi:3-phosphoglycerate kinase
MATRIWAVGPAGVVENVQENVGPTATSAIIAVIVDLSTSVTGAGAVARTASKAEVLQSLKVIEERIIKGNWPPA